MMIDFLAVNNGQQVSYNRLSQICGLDDKTVKNYLEILKETFLIKINTPWYTNKNKELVKMPKVYFIDNGVRNFFINNFNPPEIREDSSYLFEEYVISELLKLGYSDSQIKFWRIKNKHEVDIIKEVEGKVIPVEVKYKKNLKKSDLLSLKNFLVYYPYYSPAYLVNLRNNKVGMNGIRFISPFELSTLKS